MARVELSETAERGSSPSGARRKSDKGSRPLRGFATHKEANTPSEARAERQVHPVAGRDNLARRAGNRLIL